MDNKSKSERILELLPKLLGAKTDQNWSGLVAAIGQEDDKLAKLVEDVRDQFFVKTASRPYLDRLAANSNISRPRFIGMGDTVFRKYVPVLSYQPKQVKLIIDTLLDMFFLKEATTAFLSSSVFSPFVLENGWTLQFNVDNINEETIIFNSADFSDISAATADEVVAAYNRQAQYSYAINFYDSVTKHNYIRIYSNTIGSQGSLQIDGGLANIGLQLNGFITAAGTGVNTQWNVTKVGDLVTFTYTGGALPGLNLLLVGDIFLCDLPGNKGSFPITAINIQTSSFQFTNILATPGSVTQASANQTKYVRPEKYTAYKVSRRALVWETTPGSLTVEMPATPPIVERGLKGGFHINGVESTVTNFNNSTSLTLVDASKFPSTGNFILEPTTTITARLRGGLANEVVTYSADGRLISNLIKYKYTSKSGNTLLGIQPDLPLTAGLDEVTLSALSRTSDIVTATGSHNYEVGDHGFLSGSSGIPILITTGNIAINSPTLTSVSAITGIAPGQLVIGAGIPTGTQVLSVTSSSTVLMTKSATATSSGSITFSENTNGPFIVTSTTLTTFTFNQLGADGSAGIPGLVSLEESLIDSNSSVILTTAIGSNVSGIKGPYVWDPNAPFTLSSNVATSSDSIIAGKIIPLLNISNNTIPNQEGSVIFNYGQNNQEGPVKYLYKPVSNILALDPSYTFQQNHPIGSPIVALSHSGAHIMSGTGAEYPPYATNPPDARIILQNLISSVASAGIFIDFLIRFPVQLYGTLSVYD